jgi:hypothetical protein
MSVCAGWKEITELILASPEVRKSTSSIDESMEAYRKCGVTITVRKKQTEPNRENDNSLLEEEEKKNRIE